MKTPIGHAYGGSYTSHPFPSFWLRKNWCIIVVLFSPPFSCFCGHETIVHSFFLCFVAMKPYFFLLDWALYINRVLGSWAPISRPLLSMGPTCGLGLRLSQAQRDISLLFDGSNLWARSHRPKGVPHYYILGFFLSGPFSTLWLQAWVLLHLETLQVLESPL